MWVVQLQQREKPHLVGSSQGQIWRGYRTDQGKDTPGGVVVIAAVLAVVAVREEEAAGM